MIPLSWKILGAIVLAGSALAVGSAYHSRIWHEGYNAAVATRSAQVAAAVFRRVQDNTAISIKQDSINAILTKAKNEELAPVVRRIYVDRVRVGAASCGGPSTAAKTEDAASSDGADSPGRLVRADVERDTRALTEAVELDLATGRACQAWGKENGFIP